MQESLQSNMDEGMCGLDVEWGFNDVGLCSLLRVSVGRGRWTSFAGLWEGERR